MAVAELETPGDDLQKLNVLERFLPEHWQDHDFLMEYTGLLGQSERYESIPSVIAQAELLGHGSLPWQLYAHAAQALFSLQRHREFQRMCDKVLADPELAADARKDIISMLEESKNHEHH